MLVLAVPVTAAAPTRVWVARVGSGGANGNVVVTLPATGSGTLAIALRGMPPGSLVSGAVHLGTCAAQGAVVAMLPAGRATPAGRFSKRRVPSATEARSIASAASLVATIRAGSVRRCAPLVERATPAPTPTPTATPTPAPTPTATTAATPTPAPGGVPTQGPLQVGQKVMIAGKAYLTVGWVSSIVDGSGTPGVLIGVTFEAFVAGLDVSSSQFTLVEPNGALQRPAYCSGCDPDVPFWALTLPTTLPCSATLLFPAPVLGPLDLRYAASWGSTTFHIRN